MSALRILVIDDDAVTRKLLANLLGDYGRCIVVESGKAGLREIRAKIKAGSPFDLVCLDIMMGEMDGHEVLEHARSIERDAGLVLGKGAKILMVTALNDASNVMRAFRNQCDGFITKPITREGLQQELKKIGAIVAS